MDLVYIDTETSVSREWLETIGIDVQNLLYLHVETVEDIFECIENIITKIRESDRDRLVTILVDKFGRIYQGRDGSDFDKDGCNEKNCYLKSDEKDYSNGWS